MKYLTKTDLHNIAGGQYPHLDKSETSFYAGMLGGGALGAAVFGNPVGIMGGAFCGAILTPLVIEMTSKLHKENETKHHLEVKL